MEILMKAKPTAKGAALLLLTLLLVGCTADQYNPYGPDNPPKFKSISSMRSDHVCGITTEDSIICWGSWNQVTNPPRGKFKTVSAGYQHACAIKDDGSIKCWGKNEYMEVPPPPGKFKALSVREKYACGLREEGTITCWGTDPPEPPEGTFKSLHGTCALNANGPVHCWERRDKDILGIPPEEIVRTGPVDHRDHECLLGSDDSINCSHIVHQNEPDEGPYLSLPETRTPCVINADGEIRCWREDLMRRGSIPRPPEGKYSKISGYCAVRTDGAPVCWGNQNHFAATEPAGRFRDVSTGYERTCAIKDDQTIRCWGWYTAEGDVPPEGEFLSVVAITRPSTGIRNFCALGTDQSIQCWGFNAPTSPEGQFTSITASGEHLCGLRSNGPALCWDLKTEEAIETPDNVAFAQIVPVPHEYYGDEYCGITTDQLMVCTKFGKATDFGHDSKFKGHRFKQITSGWRSLCAVSTTNTLHCEIWTGSSGGYPSEKAPKEITQVATYLRNACGIKTDQTVECWDSYYDISGLFRPPKGQFTKLSISETHACGIRPDMTIECWPGTAGIDAGVPAPWHLYEYPNHPAQ